MLTNSFHVWSNVRTQDSNSWPQRWEAVALTTRPPKPHIYIWVNVVACRLCIIHFKCTYVSSLISDIQYNNLGLINPRYVETADAVHTCHYELAHIVTFALRLSVRVAQMVRASHRQSEGCGFDFLQGHKSFFQRLSLIPTRIQKYSIYSSI